MCAHVKRTYRAALRFDSLSWAYDPIAMRLVRAGAWRQALVEAVAPAPGERILDLGCGTGSLCLMLKARCPQATIIGLDPDPSMLARAERKAARAGLDIAWIEASATALPQAAPLREPFDACVSSLMFHHLTPAEKKAALAEAFRATKAGGRIAIADWGPPRTPWGRLGFLITQLFDGFETTRDHATAAFFDMIAASGFVGACERGRWGTAVGVLCLYSALKPGGTAVRKA